MKKHIITIGGGIVGSSAAFYLSQDENVQVTLIDYGVGSATRAAAGIICPWMSRRRNKAWYHLTNQGAIFYSQLMKDLTATGISSLPYQRTGSLIFKKNQEHLQEQQQLVAERRKDTPMIGDVEVFLPEELTQLIPQLDTPLGAVHASGGGRVNGNQLLDNLQETFVRNNGRLLSGEARLVDFHTVQVHDHILTADHIILATGAWLPQILSPHGYQVDVRPQKGQLLEMQTDWNTAQWPGCMLPGESDILPFPDGLLVVGATHEDDQGYDLTIIPQKLEDMKKGATEFIPSIANLPISKTRVGTRAYTSDFSPFYGNLADQSHIWVASGLGSSGLTSGPFIGWHLAQEILGKATNFDRSAYSPDKYIKKA